MVPRGDSCARLSRAIEKVSADGETVFRQQGRPGGGTDRAIGPRVLDLTDRSLPRGSKSSFFYLKSACQQEIGIEQIAVREPLPDTSMGSSPGLDKLNARVTEAALMLPEQQSDLAKPLQGVPDAALDAARGIRQLSVRRAVAVKRGQTEEHPDVQRGRSHAVRQITVKQLSHMERGDALSQNRKHDHPLSGSAGSLEKTGTFGE